MAAVASRPPNGRLPVRVIEEAALPDGFGDGVVDVEESPTRADSVASDVKSPVTALPLLHELPGDVLAPSTKLTIAHYGKSSQCSCYSLARQMLAPARSFGEARTWYKVPSGALATTLMMPVLLTQDLGAVTAGSQKLPRPLWSTIGNSCVQLPAALSTSVPRISHFACGWPSWTATESPSTWNVLVVVCDRSGTLAPHGAFPSLFSSIESPSSDGGVRSRKCEFAVEANRNAALARVRNDTIFDDEMMGRRKVSLVGLRRAGIYSAHQGA